MLIYDAFAFYWQNEICQPINRLSVSSMPWRKLFYLRQDKLLTMSGAKLTHTCYSIPLLNISVLDYLHEMHCYMIMDWWNTTVTNKQSTIHCIKKPLHISSAGSSACHEKPFCAVVLLLGSFTRVLKILCCRCVVWLKHWI